MTRSVEEWIGKTDDAAIPDRVRVRVLERSKGRCVTCTRKVGLGLAWQCDHIVALVNGGQHRESNLQAICLLCHIEKTTEDVAIKSRTYEIRKRDLGLKKPKGRPMAGTKRSGWKQKIGGGWVKR